MKVWVDCTAAAHPLVLRADHRAVRGARATRSSSPPASTGRRSASSTGSGCRTRRSASTAALRSWARCGRSAARSARLGEAGLEAAAGPGARPRVGRPGGRLGGLHHPVGPDAGLRVRAACSARSPSGSRSGCWCRTRSRSSGWPRSAPRSEKLVRYPGLKEEYYLADFEPDPAVLGELGLDREKVLVVVRPPPETSEYHARNDLYGATIAASPGPTEAQAVVIPRTDRAGRGGAGARRRQPDRARARDRRPEPDRLRRPRGQRRGDDEPRGRRPRHPRLHDLQPAGWAGSTRR